MQLLVVAFLTSGFILFLFAVDLRNGLRYIRQKSGGLATTAIYALRCVL
jgi:hypothetical protein